MAPRQSAAASTFRSRLREYGAWLLEDALKRNGGSPTKAAKELGLCRQTIYAHCIKYGVKKAPEERARAMTPEFRRFLGLRS